MKTRKPRPESDAYALIWDEASLRDRMMSEAWLPDLKDALRGFYAAEVLETFSTANMARNLVKHACESLNTLYDDTPTVAVRGENVDLSAISTPELWSLRQDAQGKALSTSASLLRTDVIGGRIRYRVVDLHSVEMGPDDNDPGQPAWVRETRPRVVNGVEMWTRETWRADPNDPLCKVEAWRETEIGGVWVDVTAEAMPDLGDKAYPYTDADGPIPAYVLIPDKIRNHLCQPYIRAGLVSTTLAIGCLNTFWLHGVRDCANAQMVVFDAMPVGAIVDGPNGGAAVTRLLRNPSGVWQFQSRQGLAGRLEVSQSTMDPLGMAKAIAEAVEQAYHDEGLGPSDEAPAKGVSGTAIQVSREALRRSQRRQMPAAKRADCEILANAARLANAYLGASLPTDPAAYSIEYHGIALSTDEVRATVDRATRLLEAGLTERWRAIREAHPHLSEDEARAMADRIDAARKPPPPAAPAPPPEDPEDDDTGDTHG